jgi:hypothetical protein
MSSKQLPDALKQLLAESVKASGFPFQAKIQNLIESSSEWKVLGTEYPWSYEGREEFLDIVAYHQNIHLVIECKKSGILRSAQKKHGLDWFAGAPKRSFVFLCRNNGSETYEETSRTLVTYFREEDIDDDPGTVYGAQAEQWQFEPKSYEAGLCVTVDADSPKEMLERDLSLLVRGCHEFARSYYRFLWEVGASITEVFLPVFVTTSPLFVLDYHPDRVAVEDGTFELESDEIRQVPWVRFRKALMAEGSQALHERTVIVVEARHFEEFLERFAVVTQP